MRWRESEILLLVFGLKYLKCKWANFLFYLEYIIPKTKARAWENSGYISMRKGRMSNIGGAQLFFPHTLMDFFFFFFFGAKARVPPSHYVAPPLVKICLNLIYFGFFI